MSRSRPLWTLAGTPDATSVIGGNIGIYATAGQRPRLVHLTISGIGQQWGKKMVCCQIIGDSVGRESGIGS
jgi:hypothetical protein